jgi:Family of unknown function (DUF6311)
MERMQASTFSRARWVYVIPIALALAAYWLVTGGQMLAPGRIGWLEHADLAQSYLGWAFYRHDPWTVPFGANPSYGLEFHSSVYYSDSIPLIAMALKPVAAWLPEPFQYFGAWVALCFLLQAVFAWRLLGLSTLSLGARALGCVFFLLAPPMLVRLGGHMALVGQWTILAALYLYLRPVQTRQRDCWTLLVAATMLIHAYLFLMVALIWAADLLRRVLAIVRTEPRGWRAALGPVMREGLQVVGATVAVAWLAGFFMVPGNQSGADGFGYYKMNLLAPFDGAGWSALGLRSAQAPGEYEGFNYLGVGGIALCLLAIPAWLLKRGGSARWRELWPLAAIAILLALVAVTPHIGFGALQWQLPLPEAWQKKLSHSSIQSTGRLFWVSYYALFVAAFFALARALSARYLIATLSLLVVLQLWDLHPGLENLRSILVTRAQSQDASMLGGSFWSQAGSRYTTLRIIPTRILAPGWERLAFYALDHRMSTDAVQVARANWKLFNRARDRQNQLLASGSPEPETLYILDPSVTAGVAASARQADAVFALDGLNILVPGWGVSLPPGAIDLKPHQATGSTQTAVP